MTLNCIQMLKRLHNYDCRTKNHDRARQNVWNFMTSSWHFYDRLLFLPAWFLTGWAKTSKSLPGVHFKKLLDFSRCGISILVISYSGHFPWPVTPNDPPFVTMINPLACNSRKALAAVSRLTPILSAACLTLRVIFPLLLYLGPPHSKQRRINSECDDVLTARQAGVSTTYKFNVVNFAIGEPSCFLKALSE